MSYITPLGFETFCNSTPSTFANTSLVRVFNPNTTTSFLMTFASNSTVNTASYTIGPLQSLNIKKGANTLLSCNAATNQVLVSPVGY